jgi:hypothetical protein
MAKATSVSPNRRTPPSSRSRRAAVRDRTADEPKLMQERFEAVERVFEANLGELGRQLIELYLSGRAVVGGVELDLRHEDLDAMWHAPIAMFADGIKGSDDAPFLWFPWFETALAKTLSRLGPKTARGRDRMRHAFLRDGELRTPDCLIQVGDKIEVERVSSEWRGDVLDHEHDAMIKRAHIRVVRAGGKVISIRRPIILKGITNVIKEGSTESAFFSIAVRAFLFLKEPMKGNYRKLNVYGQMAVSRCLAVEPLLSKMKATAADTKASRSQRKLANEVVATVNDAVLMGYGWAKTEEYLRAKPLAEQALRAKEVSALAGSKSGETRRKNAERTWRPLALDFAKRVRVENPSASNSTIADEITFRWRDTKIKAPGHRRLEQFVSEMIGEGSLAPKSKGSV